MVEFVLGNRPQHPYGIRVAESATGCILEEAVDHPVRLDSRNAEQHQEVVGCRVSDPRDGAERGLDRCCGAYVNVPGDVDAFLTQLVGSLPDSSRLGRPAWCVLASAGGYLKVVEAGCPGRYALSVDLGNKLPRRGRRSRCPENFARGCGSPAGARSRHRAEPLTLPRGPVDFPVFKRWFYFVAGVTVLSEVLRCPDFGIVCVNRAPVSVQFKNIAKYCTCLLG
jgi:hypothetical protein